MECLGKYCRTAVTPRALPRAGAFFGGGCALGRFEVRQEVAELPGQPAGLCLARCPCGRGRCGVRWLQPV